MRRRATVPARVNIIGEHTDYSGGFALPFAIQERLVLEVDFTATEYIGHPTVVQLWAAAGGPPAELSIDSNIPIGKGMSSSAALCVAIALCVSGESGTMEICHLAQRIEHQVLGTKCGLLDQMAMIFAKKDHATLIDFSTHSIEWIELPLSWQFKLYDSQIHRTLSSTEYGIESTYQMKHVAEENQRVIQSLKANSKELGDLINQSHKSLQQLGVSLPAIDEKVRELQRIDGVLGARMMGGGFGGMILVLVEDQHVLPEAIPVISSGPAIIEEFL